MPVGFDDVVQMSRTVRMSTEFFQYGTDRSVSRNCIVLRLNCLEPITAIGLAVSAGGR